MKSRFRPKAVLVYSILGTILVLAIAHVTNFTQNDNQRRNSRPRNGPGARQREWRSTRQPIPAPQGEYKMRKQFDRDDDKILNAEERATARAFLAKERAEGRGPRRGAFGGGMRASSNPVEPGLKITPADVQTYSNEPLYDPGVLRTFFLEFESADWEQELSDFYRTDVEVPAKLTVDGKTYPGVGVHFRGASSYFTVEAGRKHSMTLSLDFIDEKQSLLGYRTLGLLNSHTDPSFLHTILYNQIARDYIPAPKANFARVVINGESWGIYVNAQHFNKEFVKEWFPKSKGARWKVPGSPRGQGGLNYLEDDPDPYKRIYEIKSKDEAGAWRDLIQLCKVVSQTPLDDLEAELNKVLDVDGALKFLAIENALINSDGYWIRSSDYNLFQDENGRFHIVPHDANETFSPPGGPGFGGRGGEPRGVDLDPLAGVDDPSKPLLNRVLAVPKLRERYFGYLRQIAEQSLDWEKIAPAAERYQALIALDVKADTRKLYSTEAFEKSLREDFEMEDGFRGPRLRMSLKSFVEQRRQFLLQHPDVKKASIPK